MSFNDFKRGKLSCKLLNKKRIVSLISNLIGIFFIFSGGAKLWGLDQFLNSLSSYDLIPQMFTPILLYGIPIVEIICGLLLFTKWQMRKISFLLLVLVFLFTLAAFIKYQNGEIGDCGCFGTVIKRKNNWQLFLENTVLISALGYIHYSEI